MEGWMLIMYKVRNIFFYYIFWEIVIGFVLLWFVIGLENLCNLFDLKLKLIMFLLFMFFLILISSKYFM